MPDNYREHVYCPNGCTVRSGMCDLCVVQLKRNLAIKVLAVIDEAAMTELRIVNGHELGGFVRARNQIHAAVKRLFTSEQIDVERR